MYVICILYPIYNGYIEPAVFTVLNHYSETDYYFCLRHSREHCVDLCMVVCPNLLVIK